MNTTEILFITVNYKDIKITENFLDSIRRLDGIESAKVVIVDNESTPGSKKNLQRLVKRYGVATKIIYSEKNRYYWGGVAYALERISLSYKANPNWIIACNNDILFRQKDFLLKLSRIDPESYPVIAPSIISTITGKNLNPYMIKPIKTMAKIYYGIFFLNHITALMIYRTRNLLKKLVSIFNRRIPPKHISIYAPHGAFIIFSNLFFQKGGWLDNKLTMNGEEFTVAEISKKLGLSVFFNPQLEVMHVEHSSTNKQGWKQKFNTLKRAYYYCKEEYL